MSQLLDKPVSVQRGWDYLKAYELKLKAPHKLTVNPIHLSKKSGKKTKEKS